MIPRALCKPCTRELNLRRLVLGASKVGGAIFWKTGQGSNYVKWQ